MRQADVLEACYARLNVPAVTGFLSTQYGGPAIFQVGRVPRDDAGDAQFFPYITISVPSDVDFSDKLDLGGSAIVQVDVWDRSGSVLLLGDKMRAVSLATVRQPWIVPGFIACERVDSEIRDDPDGLTKHGMVRLRVRYID